MSVFYMTANDCVEDKFGNKIPNRELMSAKADGRNRYEKV